jgi:U3 small nucleolar RNA-associated protein 3
MSRKDKKDIKRRLAESQQALNNVLDIGDIGEFDELNELSEKYKASSKFGEVKAPSESKRSKGSGGQDSASALQLAVSAFMNASGSKKPNLGDDVEDVFADTSKKVKKSAGRKSAPALEEFSGEDDDEGYGGGGGAGGGDYDDGFEDDEFDKMLSNGDNDRKRRRAPIDEDDGEDEENMLDAFSSRKKEYVQKKKDFYTAAPRFGGLDDAVDEDAKRGITYEIMANKGLMPHRKKANRNPRVKKREMYAKALTARKGQVRDVIVGAAGAYGGEKTGIKSNVSRSRKIQT